MSPAASIAMISKEFISNTVFLRGEDIFVCFSISIFNTFIYLFFKKKQIGFLTTVLSAVRANTI